MSYDAIIVGARCAGSPLAMLLARKGCKVLLVDKAAFPSETISTHYIHNSGSSRLHRWGLLDRVRETGTPAIGRVRYDFGEIVLEASPAACNGIQEAFAPRRAALDKILLDSALAAGAAFRESFVVEDLIQENGRISGIRGRHHGAAQVAERASVVVGADGASSVVAKFLSPPEYNQTPALTCFHYSYWSGLNAPDCEVHLRPDMVTLCFPTDGDLTLVGQIRPLRDLDTVRSDIERAFYRSLDDIPELADRVRAGRREERFFGMVARPNFFRKPFGPGWALAGDAGYQKDPITAQGMRDAFRDADLLSEAILDGSPEALRRFEILRNEESEPIYRMTMERASFAQPPQEAMALIAALRGNQEQTDRWAGVDSGSVSPADFYSPENIAQIMASPSPR